MAKDEKPPAEKKPGKPRSALYEISGEKATPKNKSCPKCGQGFYLAAHKNRLTCGKCKYVEAKQKPTQEKKPEEKPTEQKPKQ